MSKTSRVMAVLSYLVIFIICLELPVNIVSGRVKNEVSGPAAQVVKKDERTTVFESGFGSISTVDIDDGTERNNYHLQFINMEPNALFLPVLLHADMVFYVRSGNGILSWTEDDKINKVNLQRGDLYRLQSGTLFYLNSNNTNTFWSVTPSLRIVAIFADPVEEQLQGPSVGPYSTINELVRGFDDPVLQSAFQVPEGVIQELTNAADTAVIVSADQQSKEEEEEFPFVKAMFGIQRLSMRASENKKKKHTKTFNFFKQEPDFENCNGWGKFVSRHDLHALRDSQIGIYMMNITPGSMMGPHWNPYATEVIVVLEGEGMVQVVCASSLTNKDCKNTRIRVEEGDVFTVPRFHPVAQMSFNSDSLVFMGFSTISKKDNPQFLVGKASFLQKLDKGILGVAFNVSNTTIGQLTSVKKRSILQDCTSCAEKQEGISEEERGTGRRGEGEREAEKEKERRGEGEGEPGARRQEEERRERQKEGGRSEEEPREERRRREETEEEEERQREEETQERREEERRERQEEGGRSEEESREERRRREETEEEEERQREEETQERREEERRERQEEGGRSEEESREERRRREETEEEEERQREEGRQERREEERRERQEEGGRSEEESKEEMGRREETEEEGKRQREEGRRERREESERHEDESEEEMGRRPETEEEEEEVERRGEEEEAGRRWIQYS